MKGLKDPPPIWTIGHSNRSIEEFVHLLKINLIKAVADVRRFPGSRKYPQYGIESLAESLEQAGIIYRHFPKLGGRRTPRKDSHNDAWRNAAFRGYADYMETDDFEVGIRELRTFALDTRTAIMCAESLWWQCHRSLIADDLKAEGYRVTHIISSSKTQEHPFTSAARLVNGELTYSAAAHEPELCL